MLSCPAAITGPAKAAISVATEMSTTRTGAIIVIEGQVALGEFVETGARLDALVSVDLLKTIFYPGTSLHDMAVVIRDNRIVAARVQLPLAEADAVTAAAENGRITDVAHGGELGSRHRAALGITSGSDSICVVVSEESGAISISPSSPNSARSPATASASICTSARSSHRKKP